MSILDSLVIGAQGGQQSRQGQSSRQGQQGPGLMSILSKATKSGHSALVSGAMSLVSAYRSRNRDRRRAMQRAIVGVSLMALGVWQIRRKSKSGGGQSSGGKQSGGQRSGSQRSGGQQTGGQQSAD